MSTPAEQATEAISRGVLVEVTEEDYVSSVRDAIQVQAGKWIDLGYTVQPNIALYEIQRLDKLFGLNEEPPVQQNP